MLPSTGSLTFGSGSLFLWRTPCLPACHIRQDNLLFVFIHQEVIWALSKTAVEIPGFLDALSWGGTPLELAEVLVKNLQANKHIPAFPTSSDDESFLFQTLLEEEDYSFDIQLLFEQPATPKLMREIILLQNGVRLETAAKPVVSMAAVAITEEPTPVAEIPTKIPEIPTVPPVQYKSMNEIMYGHKYIHGQERVVFKFRGAKPKI